MQSLVFYIAIIIFISMVFLAATSNVLLVIFIVLAGLLVLLMYNRNQDIKKNIYKVPEDALNIVNLDVGGVIKLTGVGNDREDMTLKVISKHLYTQGDYFWHEYECDKGTGDKVWLEVEEDDNTIVSITLEELSLNQIGVSKSELANIDDKEEGHINYKHHLYNYEDSDEAVFYRHCDDAKPEKLYYWDFECPSKKESISVEKWGDNEYKVYLSQILLPHQVTVYSIRGDI